MAENKEEKPELERIYVINLRRQVIKTQRYRRAKKAIRTLKEFLAKHMKVENRDLLKVKVDKFLNNEIWQRGIRKPLMRVKVKAKKINGIVYAELAEIPEIVKFNMQRLDKRDKVDEKALKEIAKKEQEEKPEEKTPDQKTEDKKEEKEEQKSVADAGIKEQKSEVKQAKHEAKPKQPKQQQIHRMALQK